MRLIATTVLLLLQAPPVQGSAQVVSGHIFVTRRSGNSDAVPGHEVHLLCASGNVAALSEQRRSALERAGASVYQTINPEPSPDKGIQQLATIAGAVAFSSTYLPRVIAAYQDQFRPVVLQTTRTDYQGAYSFVGLAPGSYFVYSAYSDASNDAVWVVPVSVSGGGAASLDLGAFNITDLRRLVRFDAIASKRTYIDGMVARYVTRPSDRLVFADGEVAGLRNGASAPLPETLLSPEMSCH